MAERRMFSKVITDTDAFLEMPLSTQALYFHLAMHADDEGFVSSPKRILRETKASEDDFKLLIVKQFVLTFDSGIIVIKHWKIHNLIQKDRFKETTYLEEKATLTLDRKNAYVERLDTPCIQNGYSSDTQVRLDKVSIGEDRLIEENAASGALPASKPRFTKPTLEEIIAYCEEQGNNVDPQAFFDFYESKGWRVGNQPMKDWKACVRTWERREKPNGSGKPTAGRANGDKYKRED